MDIILLEIFPVLNECLLDYEEKEEKKQDFPKGLLPVAGHTN